MNLSIFSRRAGMLRVLTAFLALCAWPLAAQDGQRDDPLPVVATSEPVEVTFGTGSFDLLNPAGGLADLAGYQATLTVSFDGIVAGQAEQWSRTYTMRTTQMPPVRQITIENAEQQIWTTEIGGMRYERRNGGLCIANPVEAEGVPLEPADFLDSVIGAEEAGEDTVDGVAADRYHFDERAIGAADIAESEGELWIASNSGVLLRYTLTTTSGSDYFGEGVEGMLRWDYLLTGVNQPQTFEVPADCPPPVLDLPMMPDAADVLHYPGWTSYTTASVLDDVIAFYEAQVAAAGGQPSGPPLRSLNGGALYGFTQDNRSLVLIASEEEGGTSVLLRQLADPATLAVTVEMPPIVIAPEDTLGHCAAGGVPIVDDATDLITLPGGLSFLTISGPEDVVALYTEQLTVLGAEITSPMTISGITSFEAVKGYHKIRIVILQENQQTYRVSLTSNTGSPVTPITQCVSASTDVACSADVIPMIPGAANMQTMMGTVMYTTSASIADVAAYYEAQIEAAGGQMSVTMPASDMMAMMEVRLGDSTLMLMIAANGRDTAVSFTSLTGGALPPLTACGAPP